MVTGVRGENESGTLKRETLNVDEEKSGKCRKGVRHNNKSDDADSKKAERSESQRSMGRGV